MQAIWWVAQTPSRHIPDTLQTQSKQLKETHLRSVRLLAYCFFDTFNIYHWMDMIAVRAASGAGGKKFCQILYPLRGPTCKLETCIAEIPSWARVWQ